MCCFCTHRHNRIEAPQNFVYENGKELMQFSFLCSKQAYELSTLTGTQVLLLVVSETGLVYTFTTVKLQPIVTKPEGKNLIQACLNAPDPVPNESSSVSIFIYIYIYI